MAFIEYKPEFKVGSYIMLQEELEVTGKIKSFFKNIKS